LSTILAPLFQHVRAKRVLAPLSEQDLQAVIERAENECVRLLDSREAAN